MSNTTTSPAVVIFLDIDGVLLPFGYQEEDPNSGRLFPSCTLKPLASVLMQVPQAQLVLSSTWRVQQSFIDMITQDFAAFGGVLANKDFVDITDPNLHSERQHEVYEWLQRHQKAGNTQPLAWIAIDDEELLEGEPNSALRHIFEHHVVRTDSHVGLTMEDANHAVKLVQRQLRKDNQQS